MIERFESLLGWQFNQLYGLTETSPLLTINRCREPWDELEPAERARLLSRAGTPAVGVRVRIDENGELLARSNNVFEGYWERPDLTQAAIVDGWFHTGDGGFQSDDGFVTITDRFKDVIISGGENVSSIEVEDRLYQHPDVAEAAVIGVPDEKWGETVKALVVLRDGAGADEPEIISFCREGLAHYKCPTSVEVRERAAAHGDRASCRSSSCASRTGPAASAASPDGAPRSAAPPRRSAGGAEPASAPGARA